MDDLLFRILGSLIQVHHDHGSEAYDRAGRRALRSIAKVILEETSDPETVPKPALGTIVQFPLEKARGADPGD